MSFPYFEYSGAGNTFFLIDNRKHVYPASSFALECTVDGVILLEESTIADYKMRIFNRDGSEAEMCGNGLRCLIRFLNDLGIPPKKFVIETLAGLQTGWIEGDLVSIQLSKPHNLQLQPPFFHLNTGVPHTLFFVEDLENVNVQNQGKEIRHHPHFAPSGTNVNFVKFHADHSLSIRTYERGVEAETLACGTGAVACALIASKVYGIPSPIAVKVRSGEILKVLFTEDWNSLILQGPAIRVCDAFFE